MLNKHQMEEPTGQVSDFSKYWLLLQKAHEKEIHDVTDERDKLKILYEAECNAVNNLRKEVER